MEPVNKGRLHGFFGRKTMSLKEFRKHYALLEQYKKFPILLLHRRFSSPGSVSSIDWNKKRNAAVVALLRAYLFKGGSDV
jgi:hypothetical protein